MPGEHVPIATGLEQKARDLRDAMAKAGVPWRGPLIEILLGNIRNTKDVYRKLMLPEPAKFTAAAGGGGSAPAVPAPEIPLCRIEYETERIGMEEKPDGTFKFEPMQPVTFAKFERVPVHNLYGMAGTHQPRRIVGSLWIETLDGGLTQKRYYISMTPASAHGTISVHSLLGFNIGFGRYGSERLQFRLDMYEYRRSGTSAEITSLTSEVHHSSKWQTTEGASPSSGLITDAILATYQSSGLRLKCNLTVWGI